MSLPGKPKKKNLIKNPIKHFYFIKSETSDPFVNHFDGHFAYLKTLDFYFNGIIGNLELYHGVSQSNKQIQAFDWK